MYCIDTEALVFMFNGGSSYGFTIHPIFTRICMLSKTHPVGPPAASCQHAVLRVFHKHALVI